MKRSLMEYLQFYVPTLHSFFYLALLNVETVVFIYLVIFSLLVMDIFHILILLVMVIAMFNENFINRHIVLLLVYANFFIFSKYVYTLAVQNT